MSDPIIEVEAWEAIHDFDGRYSVSNLGRVKSHLRCRGTKERILKPYPTGNRGDLKVDFGGNPRRTFLVAVLVARAFLKPDPFRNEVNHLDGNFWNNHADNLEWSTHSENILHSYHVLGKGHEHPNYQGVQNHNAKLTDDLVRKYRAMQSNGVAVREIVESSGLHRKTVKAMLAGVTWRHIH